MKKRGIRDWLRANRGKYKGNRKQLIIDCAKATGCKVTTVYLSLQRMIQQNEEAPFSDQVMSVAMSTDDFAKKYDVVNRVRDALKLLTEAHKVIYMKDLRAELQIPPPKFNKVMTKPEFSKYVLQVGGKPLCGNPGDLKKIKDTIDVS